jgi:hypothetical protein
MAKATTKTAARPKTPAKSKAAPKVTGASKPEKAVAALKKPASKAKTDAGAKPASKVKTPAKAKSAAKPKPSKGVLKQTTDAIAQLASDILHDRIEPTIEQIKSLAASALSQDQKKGKRNKKK